MICVSNMVAAVTVGLLGRESSLIRQSTEPSLYYIVVAGILGGLLHGWIDR
ncbi:MAG: L-lactate permease [Synechococcales cyanobacterium T60_A2020_003]|nr:L-lactate permease [Synechococcales cyanobacterium T60_A2020_003]